MTSKTKIPGEGGIILFDGVCHLCERSVQFVIRHDPYARFMFAPLQSDYAHGLIEEQGLGIEEQGDDAQQRRDAVVPLVDRHVER